MDSSSKLGLGRTFFVSRQSLGLRSRLEPQRRPVQQLARFLAEARNVLSSIQRLGRVRVAGGFVASRGSGVSC